MISFDEGYARIAALAAPVDSETIALEASHGRVLRAPITAKRPQPPSDNSAMDGYALAGAHEHYELIGEIPAGARELPQLQSGQAVRIFTGAPLPEGADRILIQENAVIHDNRLSGDIPQAGAHIRRLGQDFKAGFTLEAPLRLSAGAIALAAALNTPSLSVARKPRVAILPTGSELVEAGAATSTFDIISTNSYGLAAIAQAAGAETTILPILADDAELITAALAATEGFDLVITSGGASVGDYDLVPDCARKAGFSIDFHKIAMRPGKPVLAGKRDHTVFLGLPGNPVSAMVTGGLFVPALIDRFLGLETTQPARFVGRLRNDLAANGERLQFMRAEITPVNDGFDVFVFDNQDSAMLSILAKTNGLVVREPNQPASYSNETVNFIWMNR